MGVQSQSRREEAGLPWLPSPSSSSWPPSCPSCPHSAPVVSGSALITPVFSERGSVTAGQTVQTAATRPRCVRAERRTVLTSSSAVRARSNVSPRWRSAMEDRTAGTTVTSSSLSVGTTNLHLNLHLNHPQPPSSPRLARLLY